MSNPRKTETVEASSFADLFEMLERKNENEGLYLLHPKYTLEEVYEGRLLMGAKATIELDDLEMCETCGEPIQPAQFMQTACNEPIHKGCLQDHLWNCSHKACPKPRE